MARIGKELVLGADLHHLAEIHHRDPVGHVLHHRQIVRDEQVGKPEPRLQILEQIDHLRLDGNIQRRYRLVADDQIGLHRERAGDADALALAAREFVRIAPRVIGREPDQPQQLLDPPQPLLAVAEPVHDQRLLQDFAHRHARIERGERVLEHDLDAPP